MPGYKRKPRERVVVKEAENVQEFRDLIDIYLEKGVDITSTGWTAITGKMIIKYVELEK